MGSIRKIKFSDDVIFEYNSGKLRELSFLKSRIYNEVGRCVNDLNSRHIFLDAPILGVRKYALERIAEMTTMQELVDFTTAMRCVCINERDTDDWDTPVKFDAQIPNDEWVIGKDKDPLKMMFWNTAIAFVFRKLNRICLIQRATRYKMEWFSVSYFGDMWIAGFVFDLTDIKHDEDYKKRFSKKKKQEKKED